MLDDARQCIAHIVREIARQTTVCLIVPPGHKPDRAEWGFNDRVRYYEIPTNDTWARDFGPITVETDEGLKCVDFKFNGWGLKFAADKDNLINTRLELLSALPGPLENRLNFVLEGGSIESDGRGTILTTSRCLLSPNRNGESSKQEIEKYMANTLGAKHVLWLDHGALAGDDTDSHIDTLARLAPNDTIIYCGAGDDSDPNNDHLKAMAVELKMLRTPEGNPYHLVELPLPSPIHDENGEQLPATYANFLISNDYIYLPTYGQERKDTLASLIIQTVFPDHVVVPVDCRALIRQHGSLHCVTMQLPK